MLLVCRRYVSVSVKGRVIEVMKGCQVRVGHENKVEISSKNSVWSENRS